MALQTQIYRKQAAGVPGAFFDDSPRRVAPYLVYGDPAPVVGYAFSVDPSDPTKAIAGYSEGKIFVGILVTPKQYANYNNLSPTMTVSNGAQGELCAMGHLWVITNHTAKVGYLVCANATGEWGAAEDTESVPTGYTLLPKATFILGDAEAGGLARIHGRFIKF